MGNYRQHLTFASSTGVIYALGIFTLSGLHWVYGTVAAMLATVGGLLPDLDHPTGTELKGFTGILAVLGAVAVWTRIARGAPDVPFELHLWAVVLVYIFIRHWMKMVLARMMVHRGISHSFHCCAVWGAATYLYYPSGSDLIRLTMATAITLGFLSHLILDEMFSVDISNTRVKRSFGTAMKFWAPSLPATLAMYALLSVLSYEVIERWPAGSLPQILAEKVPAVVIPWPPPGRISPGRSPVAPSQRVNARSQDRETSVIRKPGIRGARTPRDQAAQRTSHDGQSND